MGQAYDSLNVNNQEKKRLGSRLLQSYKKQGSRIVHLFTDNFNI